MNEERTYKVVMEVGVPVTIEVRARDDYEAFDKAKLRFKEYVGKNTSRSKILTYYVDWDWSDDDWEDEEDE